jgi:hypothetical protein
MERRLRMGLLRAGNRLWAQGRLSLAFLHTQYLPERLLISMALPKEWKPLRNEKLRWLANNQIRTLPAGEKSGTLRNRCSKGTRRANGS